MVKTDFIGKEIDIYSGNGDEYPVGPINGQLIELLPDGKAKFEITDKDWLEHMGWQEMYCGPYEYKAKYLSIKPIVSYDDYGWCEKGFDVSEYELA